MLKHIGRHGDRKVAIIFRELPGEEHMCLVIYPETLPTHYSQYHYEHLGISTWSAKSQLG
jgi:hypothetical protein